MKHITEQDKAIGLVEIGPASKITKALAFFLPWYELGVPPYIYRCPSC
jgi:hypothetical protein